MSQENEDFSHYYQLLKKYNIEKIFDELNIQTVSDIETKIKFFDIFSTRRGNYIRINGKIIPGTYKEGELHPDLKNLSNSCLSKLQSRSIVYNILRHIFTKNKIRYSVLNRERETLQGIILEENTLENDKTLQEENTTLQSGEIFINEPVQYSSSGYIDKYKYFIMLLLFIFIMSLRKPFNS
jgi:hypothetical protein